MNAKFHCHYITVWSIGRLEVFSLLVQTKWLFMDFSFHYFFILRMIRTGDASLYGN